MNKPIKQTDLTGSRFSFVSSSSLCCWKCIWSTLDFDSWYYLSKEESKFVCCASSCNSSSEFPAPAQISWDWDTFLFELNKSHITIAPKFLVCGIKNIYLLMTFMLQDIGCNSCNKNVVKVEQWWLKKKPWVLWSIHPPQTSLQCTVSGSSNFSFAYFII